MDILKIMAEAQEAHRAEHTEKTQAELGRYHTGGAGIVTDSGDVIGGCPRIALARSLGIERPIEPNRGLMFALGKANEQLVYDDLRAAGVEFIEEGDLELEWTTRAGTPVGGHPDAMITETSTDPMTLEETRRWKQGLELKAVCSIWTARDVLFKHHPKSDHLIQAAVYMWRTGVPFTILYSSRVDWPVATGNANSWLQRMFNAPEFREYTELNARGEVKKILPFQAAFQLEWGPDGLTWTSELNPMHTGSTLVWPDAIERYYELLDDMRANQHLGPRPAGVEVDGSKMGYNKCDAAYCEWSGACDRCEHNYSKWLEAITK